MVRSVVLYRMAVELDPRMAYDSSGTRLSAGARVAVVAARVSS